MDLLLTCGLPWPTVLYTLLLDEVMVITGLVGALVASSYKWGYFVFATVALFFIAYNVVIVGRKHAQAISKDVAFIYQVCGVWTIFLWFLYPIAWGLSEGGNVIAPDSEAVFYGILDILAKPVFGALLLWGHRKFTPRDLGLNIRDYEDEPLHEKYGANSGVNNGVNNGTHNGVNNGTHNNGVLHGNANTTVANDSGKIHILSYFSFVPNTYSFSNHWRRRHSCQPIRSLKVKTSYSLISPCDDTINILRRPVFSPHGPWH
jgi:hypothetical protein